MTDAARGADSDLLFLQGVNKTFDGFKAINNLSISLAKGEMRAVIGPNGAGKSTMMDIITGKTKPDTGRVVFGESTDLTKLDEPSIAQLGIGRKFQKPTTFESHTVWNNLLLALAGDRRPWFTLGARRTAAESDKIEALRACGIDVASRVSHAIAANGVNDAYLQTKARRFGHLLG